MEIVKIPIDELTMYKKNAKLHPREQIEQIKQSIKMYGNNDPIGIWGNNNQIVEGHGRYIAMKELGFTECECIRLDHMTDKQRREYMLVHNQTTMNSGWDMDILSQELDGMDFEGFDFGFDEKTKGEKEEIPGEIEFTEVLGEENNYIVLKFDNSVDWLQVESLFGLKKVKAYSTRQDGAINNNMVRAGVGRVVNGVEFLNNIGVEL